MYESWFRFRHRPFAAAPRVDDYYPAESSESARKSLISCVQRGAGPGLLIGSAGSGKSTLSYQLLSHFRTRTAVALVSCSGLATRRALFQNILFELGRPYRDLDEGELRLSLVDYLTSRDASHSGTVLLFDDAHHLSVELFEDVRMLSSMVRDGHWCIHVVLTGNIGLEEILSIPNLESLNQRIAARCYLEPFRGDETSAYVRRQFERVEGNADNVFIAGALAAIHECSAGTPRLINQLCDHALLLAATGSRSQLDEHGIREAWSDLQHLPPPESQSKSRASADEIVEFGSLDQDQTPTSTDMPAGIAATERVEEVEFVHEPQHASCHDVPAAPSECETATAGTNDASSTAPELEFDTQVQFQGAESYDLEPVGADRGEDEPMDVAEIDAEKCFDMIEAQLNRYDDASPPTTENPFLEDFVEEEIIVDRPSSLLNRVVACQPPVTSRYGQELQNALDSYSIAEETDQSWRSASGTGSPRVLVSVRGSVEDVETREENRLHEDFGAEVAVGDDELPEDVAPEYAGADVTNIEMAVPDDAVFEGVVEYVSDEAVSEEAILGGKAPEFTDVELDSDVVIVEDAVVENVIVEDTLEEDVAAEDALVDDVGVTENAALEIVVPGNESRGTTDCELAVSKDPNIEGIACEESAEENDVLFLADRIHDQQQDEAKTDVEPKALGIDVCDSVEASNVAFEMHADNRPYKLDVATPTVENGEFVEVLEVELSDHPLASQDFVVQFDTESLPEREPKFSTVETRPAGEPMPNDRDLLPRDAKTGRKLNRLFSNLANR